MPTAVATSASAMLAITACEATCAARAGAGDLAGRAVAELLEGADDADDGAEEADEGRVVAEGAEEREPPLEPPRSSATALCIALSTAAGPRSASWRPAAATAAATDLGLAELLGGGGEVAASEVSARVAWRAPADRSRAPGRTASARR